MPSIPRSDRIASVPALFVAGVFLLLFGGGPDLPSVHASERSPVSQYSTLEMPVSNFGFRGIARDRNGALYAAAALRDGLYVLPPGCRDESCATLIPLAPSLGLPGEVVADPRRGGAYVLLRLGDRVDYLPPHCLSKSCLESVRLPERPAYPFRAVYDDQKHALAVLDRLADKVILVPEGCRIARCLSPISLPRHGQPSGIAYDKKRGNLWIAFHKTGALLEIPSNCRKLSCSVLFPSTVPGLDPDVPVISSSEDRLYLVLKKGTALGWVDLGDSPRRLRMQTIEATSGRIVLVSPLRTGGAFLLTGGEFPHAGAFVAGPSCPDGCFDLRLLPFKNGTPYGMSPGKKDSLWMTIDDRDSLFHLSTLPDCRKDRKAGTMVPKGCLAKIPFNKIETLYHSRYHQEIQVPSEPSTNLSDPSD